MRRFRETARERLEGMLAERGYIDCSGWNIARGWWLSAQADVQRWQCWAVRVEDGVRGRRVHIGSWDSISNCVRFGISVADGNEAGGYTDVDVMALTPGNVGKAA